MKIILVHLSFVEELNDFHSFSKQFIFDNRYFDKVYDDHIDKVIYLRSL